MTDTPTPADSPADELDRIISKACTEAIAAVVPPGNYPLDIAIIAEAKRQIEQLIVSARREQASNDIQVVFDTYSGSISPDFAFELMKERITKMDEILKQGGA